jgi:hypothetical protein
MDSNMGMPERLILVATVTIALTGTLGVSTADATTARHYATCKALNARYPHGVGLPGARDRTSGTPVTNFTRNRAVYLANTARDRDKDKIACEKH